MRWLLLSITLLLSACTTNLNNSPDSEQRPPPSIKELTITSSGLRMAGLIYLAAGKGPHPTVILLHGYPGNEKNLDLAQSLRRDGWNVLFFHYRGAWGSEGEFSFTGAEQDVQAVIRYLQTPENSRKLRVDPEKIVTVGHSMGGHMAVAAMLDNTDVSCTVALDGANMGVNQGQGLFKHPKIGKLWRDYSDTLFMLRGWSGEKAVAEMDQSGAELDLLPRAHKVANRPVLLLAADTDVIPFDLHIRPLFEALNNVTNSRVLLKTIKDDHSFSANRLQMIATVSEFLDQYCR